MMLKFIITISLIIISSIQGYGQIFFFYGENNYVYASDMDGSTEYAQNTSPVNLDLNDSLRLKKTIDNDFELTNLYTDDFTLDILFWGGINSVVKYYTNDYNSISRTNVLLDSLTSISGYSRVVPGISITVGQTYILGYRYYIPSSNTETAGIMVRLGATTKWFTEQTTLDAWIYVTETFVAVTTEDELRFYHTNGAGAITNLTVGDVYYIDDVTVSTYPNYLATGNHAFDSTSVSPIAGTYSGKIISAGAGDVDSNYVFLSAEKFTTLESGKNYTYQMQAQSTDSGNVTLYYGDDSLTTWTINDDAVNYYSYTFSYSSLDPFPDIDTTIYQLTSYPGHLQGIAVNKDSGQIFLSNTEQLFKIDTSGATLDSTAGLSTHHGGIAYYNNKIYIGFTSPDSIKVYSAITLDYDTAYSVGSDLLGSVFPGGIAYHDGNFYVAEGIGSGSVIPKIHKYDLSFNHLTSYTLPYNIYQGIQEINRFNGSWWVSTYDTTYRTIRLDDNFNVEFLYDFDAAIGFEEWGVDTVLHPNSSGRIFWEEAKQFKLTVNQIDTIIIDNVDISEAYDLTLNMWVKISSSSNGRKGLFSTTGGVVGVSVMGYNIEYNNTSWWYFPSDGVNSNTPVESFDLRTDTWQFLSVTHDKVAGEMKLYRNGVLKKTLTSTIGTQRSGGELRIGQNSYGYTYGLIGETSAIIGELYTLSQIQTEYNRGIRGLQFLNNNKVMGWWKWEGNSNTTFLKDYSGTGNDLVGINVTKSDDQVKLKNYK